MRVNAMPRKQRSIFIKGNKLGRSTNMGKNDVTASFVMDNLKPALLTRAELSWLCDSTLPLSKNYQRRFRSSIKKKVWILTDLELPLLAQKGFLNYGPVISADVTAGCSD